MDDDLHRPVIEDDTIRQASLLAERLRAQRPRRSPTFRQLYAEAKRQGIPGRSHMSKSELERVLQAR